MIKEKLTKTLGRSKITVLTVVVALVLVAAPAALAANGNPLILAKAKNAATKVTGLVGKVGEGAALLVKNPSGGAALDLQVKEGAAPMKVNSIARVDSLNADLLDDKSAGEFAPDANQNGKADTAEQADSANNANNLAGQPASAYQQRVGGSCSPGSSIRSVNANGTVTCEPVASNADKLDNKDSTAFGIKTVHNYAHAHDCHTPGSWSECAPVTVTVPAGKKYYVSVWSTFSARFGFGTSAVVEYCSAGKGAGISTTNPCITPFGFDNRARIGDELTAASSSGESLPLDPGTYTFFTGIRTSIVSFTEDNEDIVITKVMIRDATNELP